MNSNATLRVGLALLVWASSMGLTPLRGQTKAVVQEVRAEESQPTFYADDATLRDYIEKALSNNPSLQEAHARYRAALEKAPRAKGLPDPVLVFTQAIRSVETRVGPQRNMLQFSQKLPWFGKLDLKEKVALQEAEALYQLYLARQREIIVEVKRAYYDIAFLDEALHITRQERAVLEHYEELARARYASGQGLQQGVIKIQTEITKILSRLDTLTEQRVSLATKLNTLMDRSPQETVPLIDHLNPPEATLALEELFELGEQNRQELKATKALMEASEKAIDLSKKSTRPDVTIGAGFINVGRREDPVGVEMPPPDNGKNAFNVSVGINIPLWSDKNKSGVLEATEQLSAERYKYRDILNEMELSIRDLAVRIETLKGQIDLFENALIPQAEETLQSTEAAYETGQLGVLDLLDSERFLLELRLANARFYSDYLGALAALERAVGTEFPTS